MITETMMKFAFPSAHAASSFDRTIVSAPGIMSSALVGNTVGLTLERSAIPTVRRLAQSLKGKERAVEAGGQGPLTKRDLACSGNIWTELWIGYLNKWKVIPGSGETESVAEFYAQTSSRAGGTSRIVRDGVPYRMFKNGKEVPLEASNGRKPFAASELSGSQLISVLKRVPTLAALSWASDSSTSVVHATGKFDRKALIKELDSVFGRPASTERGGADRYYPQVGVFFQFDKYNKNYVQASPWSQENSDTVSRARYGASSSFRAADGDVAVNFWFPNSNASRAFTNAVGDQFDAGTSLVSTGLISVLMRRDELPGIRLLAKSLGGKEKATPTTASHRRRVYRASLSPAELMRVADAVAMHPAATRVDASVMAYRITGQRLDPNDPQIDEILGVAGVAFSAAYEFKTYEDGPALEQLIMKSIPPIGGFDLTHMARILDVKSGKEILPAIKRLVAAGRIFQGRDSHGHIGYRNKPLPTKRASFSASNGSSVRDLLGMLLKIQVETSAALREAETDYDERKMREISEWADSAVDDCKKLAALPMQASNFNTRTERSFSVLARMRKVTQMARAAVDLAVQLERALRSESGTPHYLIQKISSSLTGIYGASHQFVSP